MQIEEESVQTNMGNAFTVTTIIVLVSGQPSNVPVRVQVVVAVGLALTVAPVEELRPVAGDQIYVFAPVATKFTEAPLQIETEGIPNIAFREVTTTVTNEDPLPQSPVPITV